MISRSMPIGDVIERLVNHGCPNISNRLDLTHCNDRPCSRGGFGDVHQGTLLDGTKVALKCLRLYVDENETNDKALKYAARELHTWSKCRHPNIVELLGLARFYDQIAMVSPWMKNGSADRLNRSNNAIDRCRLCFEVARGLAYLHEVDIVHGDLKGANVLLSDSGEAQLADFGNAVLAGSVLSFTESSTQFQHSTRWTAPEQLREEVACSREADIYSLGMTILEIVSRQRPYAYIQNDPAVIMAISTQQRPRRPEDTIPTESQQGNTLWYLLESCWRWDPKGRPEALAVVKAMETIKSENLLIKVAEASATSSLPRSILGSNTPGTKRGPEAPEGKLALRQKRPRLETDKPVQIPTTHQQLIRKPTDLLNYVPPYSRQRSSDLLIGLVLDPKYGDHFWEDLLSKLRGLGVDLPEGVRLEPLDMRVWDFQRVTIGLLRRFEDSDDTTHISKFEELLAVGKRLQPRLDEVLEDMLEELEELDKIEELDEIGKLDKVGELDKMNELGDLDELDALDELADELDKFIMVELDKLEQHVARLQFFRQAQTTEDNGLTLDQVDELILRGRNMGVSFGLRVMSELTRKATSGREWKISVASVLAQPRPEMKDLNQLLASTYSIPMSPALVNELKRVWMKGREHEKRVEACLRPQRGRLVPINDAIRVATTALNDVFFPAAEELRALSGEAQTWEKTCENILAGLFKARGNATVFDEARAMRDRVEIWAFEMPCFQELVRQLAAHDDWIGQLPSTRSSYPALDLDSTLRAVAVPSTNETCTCICIEPVVVGESGQDTVVQCDHCLVMFHAKCIEGSCPFCDDQTWKRVIGDPPELKLQRLRSQYRTACKLTQQYSPEYRALGTILPDNGNSALGETIVGFIKQLSLQESPDSAVIFQIRHFMRKLYRIQVEISVRPEIFAYGLSLAHLHRQLAMQHQTKPVTRRKPQFVFKTEMDPKGLDGSRCLCSGVRNNPWRLTCSKCQSSYHEDCIAVLSAEQVHKPFVCPLCLLKEGKSYELADLLVTYHSDDRKENAKYVDVQACLDKYSWGVIRFTPPPPVRERIPVELFLFIPGTNLNVKEPESYPKSVQE